MVSLVNKFRPVPRHLWLLLAASAILLFTWSLVVPIFEAPDEPAHWDYVRYVHDHKSLPFYSAAFVEANQAPLYYLLIAPVSSETKWPDSRAWIDSGRTIVPCAPRFYQDCPSDFKKFWPIRWARLLTAVLSIGTVFFTYRAGYEATGRPYTGLLAGFLLAFLPQFSFRGVNVSNDAMVTMTSAAATYFLVLLVRRGFSWKRGVVASLCVALAFLSKVNAIIFLPVFVGALLAGKDQWSRKLKRFGVMLVGLIVVAPWLIRNKILYGDVLASKVMLAAVPILIDKKPITSPYFFNSFPQALAESFVGVFGWMNVYLPTWIYVFFAILGMLGLAGLIRCVARRMIDRRSVVLLAILPLLAIASVIQLNLTFTQPQGRYLFPALSASMVLLAIGLESLPRWNRVKMYLTIAILAGINIYALLGVEYSAYWLPLHLTGSTMLDTFIEPGPGLSVPGPPLRSGGSFGQTFRPHSFDLSAVTVDVATYREKIPCGVLTLHLRKSPRDHTDLASLSVPASRLTDWGSVTLNFPPLSDSKDKSYYFFIDTKGIPAAYPITVLISKADIYPGGQFFENEKGTSYDMRLKLIDSPVCGACGTSEK